MAYVIYVKERGEGCDYTVGCGETIITMGDELPSDAEVSEALENHGSDRDRFETVAILKIVKDYTEDEIYDLYEDESEEDAATTARRQQYETLKKEFG